MRHWFQLAIALLLMLVSRSAERVANWRAFQAGEPPTVSVTLSPRGRIIARHGDGAAMTILDGYSSRQLALAENLGYRVYESRSGQFWSVSQDGVALYQRGQWTFHSLPEIRAENLKSFRQIRPISLVPAEVNRTLILLPDRLLQFDAISSRTTTLKLASDAGLGQFNEMTEAANGDLLVSGSLGLARVAGPVRHLNVASQWTQYLLPPGSMAENVQRPFETAAGEILAPAFGRADSSIRHLLRSSEGGLVEESIVRERFRFLWSGWNGVRWGLSFNGLFRQSGRATNEWIREGSVDTYYDVAVQTNGIFFLATSSGVIRYAPLLWQAPAELSEIPCLAATQGASTLWLATSDGLFAWSDEKGERHAWPEDFESSLATIESVFEAPNGKALVSSSQTSLLFDPATRRFSPPPIAGRALGVFRDGTIALRTDNGLAAFDGDSSKLRLSFGEAGLSGDPAFVVETRSGDLWFGGAFGLARLGRGETKVILFAVNDGSSAERVQCLAEVGDDKLWAGGVDSVFELRGQRWEKIKGGIDRPRAIFRSRDGAIWVGASDGVHRFVNGAWIAHGDEEGIPSSIAHDVLQDRGGRLWAATSRGAVRYFPEADPDEPRTFTPALLENENQESAGTTVSFVGADKWNYTSAARLLYSYRIDEGAWSPFTNLNSATFENLGAGPHYVQARAMDRNGNQDPSIATLEFAVTLPWSRDPRLIGVLILGLIVVAFFAALAVNRHLRLVKSYAEVERMVAERTAQLEKANQELLHSQKMRALGTLAAGIAHDFNNILSIIKGSAQIIENNPGDREKVLTRVNRIQTVVDQGAGIVRSMLGLGKGSDVSQCDPAELVEEGIRLLGDRFPPEVRVRYEKNGEVPRLTCSKSVIHQILLNLILNAVDASGGEGEVTLRTRVVENPVPGITLAPADASRYLAIDVADKGVGISPESLPRIFEPFYTTKGFSSRRGTGLGLSMVYELAKGLGYGLAVQSTPGQGSVFTLLAPLP